MISCGKAEEILSYTYELPGFLNRGDRRGRKINKSIKVPKLILSASTSTLEILEVHIVIKYWTYTHIPIPDLDRTILTASCNKFPISAVRASCRNHPFTLN